MLVISDKGKGGGGVILLAIFLSVGAAVGTTLVVHNSMEHQERSTAPSRLIIPEVDKIRAAEQAATIAELKETVARLERAADVRDATEEYADPLAILLDLRAEVLQLAVRDQVARLIRKGDDAVPSIVAVLKTGRDDEWSGGASSAETEFERYPRLRTALLDILRQIDTPLARQGSLEALDEAASAADYCDLLTMYATTDDPKMIAGITELLPVILADVRDGQGDEFETLERVLARWLHDHGLTDRSDLLAELSLRNLKAGQPDRGAFELLLASDPGAAIAVVVELANHDPDLKTLTRRLPALGVQVPLARIADLCEGILGHLELTDSAREQLYLDLPKQPTSAFSTTAERAEDARKLIAFLEQRLAVEPTDAGKRNLRSAIDALDASSD